MYLIYLFFMYVYLLKFYLDLCLSLYLSIYPLDLYLSLPTFLSILL